MTRPTRSIAWATGALAAPLALVAALLSQPAKADDPKSDEQVVLKVTPSAGGPWTMELMNTGKFPARVYADARLLSFGVVGVPKSEAGKPVKVKLYDTAKLQTCKMPDDMKPAQGDPTRLLILKPGEKYVEQFDPLAYCIGTGVLKEFNPGAIVYPHYGWTPPKPVGKKPADPKPPFAVEAAQVPEDFAPQKEITGELFFVPPLPVIEPIDTKGLLVVDPRAPRLEVTSTEIVDATSARNLSIKVTAKNVGERDALVHIRNDDYSFEVYTPTHKIVQCDEGISKRGAVREFFHPLKAGKSQSDSMLLAERCPAKTFDRPGLYEVKASLTLSETGEEYKLAALTGKTSATNITRVRIHTGNLPFQHKPPKAEPINPPASSGSAASTGSNAPAPTTTKP